MRCVLLCGPVLLLAVLPRVNAQMPSPVANTETHFFAPITTISKTVDEVDLAFNVTDKKGRFVANLQPSDFAIFDNRSAQDGLTFFQRRSDLPLHLAILIDASDSVKGHFNFERDAAVDSDGADATLVGLWSSVCSGEARMVSPVRTSGG